MDGFNIDHLRPLTKYPGGKSRLLKTYAGNFFPSKRFSRFIDAFFGSGSCSMHIFRHYSNVRIIANELNPDLSNIYQVIRDDFSEFIKIVREFENEFIPLTNHDRKKYYYRQLERHASEYENMPNTHRAGLLYCLFYLCFSGIWRNNKGPNKRFGTPYSSTTGNKCDIGDICNDRDLRAFHHFMMGIEFYQKDFSEMIDYVDDSTYLFLDPPYMGADSLYYGKKFTDRQNIRILDMMNDAHDRGASVAMTNSLDKEKNLIYREYLHDDFEIIPIKVKYFIKAHSSNNDSIMEQNECLIRNWISPLVRG